MEAYQSILFVVYIFYSLCYTVNNLSVNHYDDTVKNIRFQFSEWIEMYK
jgi:hypothetical protein